MFKSAIFAAIAAAGVSGADIMRSSNYKSSSYEKDEDAASYKAKDKDADSYIDPIDSKTAKAYAADIAGPITSYDEKDGKDLMKEFFATPVKIKSNPRRAT